MTFVLLAIAGGVTLVVGYFVFGKRSGGSDQDRHHGGDDDVVIDIEGYRDENVEYYEDDVITGVLNDNLMERLKQKIRKHGKGAVVEYIGITSGTDPVKAMKSRVDQKKRELGINKMRLLYQTSSRDNCTKVESKLIDYSKTIHGNINKNDIGGGGGRIPADSQNYYYVYAAYK